jgi:hypothetical protein
MHARYVGSASFGRFLIGLDETVGDPSSNAKMGRSRYVGSVDRLRFFADVVLGRAAPFSSYGGVEGRLRMG